VLRRSRERRAHGTVQVGELRVDPVGREVLLGDRKIELSAKEFALLRTLAAEPARVFTKEELLREKGEARPAWPRAYAPGSRTRARAVNCARHDFTITSPARCKLRRA